MADKKDPEDMSESELKKELKKLYKKVNDLDSAQMDSMDFQGRVIVEKKNSDNEVVEKHEVEF